MATNAASRRCIERWEHFTRTWIERQPGHGAFPPPFESWYESYFGTGPAAPTRDAMAEPFIGSWDNPKLVTLGLNPGIADANFQGRDGRFTQRIREVGYAAWAATDPYGSGEWEQHNSVNRPRKDGRRVNPHREARLRFARRWLADAAVTGSDLLMLELYPWHSARWSGRRYQAPAQLLQEFIWDPVAGLDVDVVFAFAKPWTAMAERLGLKPDGEWGPEHFAAKGRRAAAFWLPTTGQRLIVVWQGGYAGPPAGEDVERLRVLTAT